MPIIVLSVVNYLLTRLEIAFHVNTSTLVHHASGIRIGYRDTFTANNPVGEVF